MVTTDKETFVKEFWTSGTHAVSFRHVSLFRVVAPLMKFIISLFNTLRQFFYNFFEIN